MRIGKREWLEGVDLHRLNFSEKLEKQFIAVFLCPINQRHYFMRMTLGSKIADIFAALSLKLNLFHKGWP